VKRLELERDVSPTLHYQFVPRNSRNDSTLYCTAKSAKYKKVKNMNPKVPKEWGISKTMAIANSYAL
jgi:hypothetical protein